MKLDIEDLRGIMQLIRGVMIEHKQYLIDLDSAVGDGDLGITMAKGFTVASTTVNEYQESDLGRALMQAGIALNNAASSTMGTLMATAMMRAGKEVRGRDTAGEVEIVAMAEAAVEGIKERGKAEVGDKTLLDAVVPAVTDLKDAVDEGALLVDALGSAYQASRKGVAATREMVSRQGRGRYYGEKSRGKQDPGAAAAMLIIEAVWHYLENQTEEKADE